MVLDALSFYATTRTGDSERKRTTSGGECVLNLEKQRAELDVRHHCVALQRYGFNLRSRSGWLRRR